MYSKAITKNLKLELKVTDKPNVNGNFAIQLKKVKQQNERKFHCYLNKGFQYDAEV